MALLLPSYSLAIGLSDPELPPLVSIEPAGREFLLTATNAWIRSFDLERSTDLREWSILTNFTAATNFAYRQPLVGQPTPRAFYRLTPFGEIPYLVRPTNEIGFITPRGFVGQFIQVQVGGNHPLRCYWFKDGAYLTNTYRTNSALHFIELPPFTEEIAGIYHVMVSNAWGKVTSAPIRLQLATP